MINYILKIVSFIFHPLLMPIAGVVFYFAKTPRFVQRDVVWAKFVSLTILTVILPILLFLLLKTIGHIKSIYLKNTKERIIPLLLNTFIVLMVITKILRPDPYIELYYFFVGILLSTLSCLILALFKFKASIHMIAITGIFMFFIALSIHFKININGTLALMCIITGAVATSRLHLKAHTYPELIIGAFIGLFPQLILVANWL